MNGLTSSGYVRDSLAIKQARSMAPVLPYRKD